MAALPFQPFDVVWSVLFIGRGRVFVFEVERARICVWYNWKYLKPQSGNNRAQFDVSVRIGVWGGRVSACDTQQFVLIVHICEKLRSPLDRIHVKPCGTCQKRSGVHEHAPPTSWNGHWISLRGLFWSCVTDFCPLFSFLCHHFHFYNLMFYFEVLILMFLVLLYTSCIYPFLPLHVDCSPRFVPPAAGYLSLSCAPSFP